MTYINTSLILFALLAARTKWYFYTPEVHRDKIFNIKQKTSMNFHSPFLAKNWITLKINLQGFTEYLFKIIKVNWIKSEVLCTQNIKINTWAAILPLIITWDPAESLLPNLNNPLHRKPVVKTPPIGMKGFSQNFLTSFSFAVSWCLFPVSLSSCNCLFSWKMEYL